MKTVWIVTHDFNMNDERGEGIVGVYRNQADAEEYAARRKRESKFYYEEFSVDGWVVK